uniref:Carboxypeptidase Q n=1 Tax=Timema californicum TaxID=61474 RepID=A0A7R9PB65_TIMCA|nr:unnamed protein product [Timema californicum]
MSVTKSCSVVLTAILVCAMLTGSQTPSVQEGRSECPILVEHAREIEEYKPIARKIIDFFLSGDMRGRTYKNLNNFVDNYGPRMLGSSGLRRAVTHVYRGLRRHNFSNVRMEPVNIPVWVRGTESATLLKPRLQRLSMVGLGDSVGTPDGPIRAETIVVRSFKELEALGDKASGKIVVFNQEFISYDDSVSYRLNGAIAAAKAGGVAALIRSVTNHSLLTPHTGLMYYQKGVPKIPGACLATEHADLLHRLYRRGKKLVIQLQMGAHTIQNKTSNNVVADLPGTSLSDKVVLISAHIDSWDIGQGAVDDGGGLMIAWGALVGLKRLGLRPRRTLRVAMFTGEEFGTLGSNQYYRDHADELRDFVFALESDEGVFSPRGLGFTGSERAQCILRHVLQHYESAYFLVALNSNRIVPSVGQYDSDIVLVALTSKRSVPSIKHYDSDIVLVALTSKRSMPSIRHYESDIVLVALTSKRSVPSIRHNDSDIVLVALTSKRSVPSIRHYDSDIVLVALTSKRSVPSIRHYESDNVLVALTSKRSVPSIRHYDSDIVLVVLTSKRIVPSIKHYDSDIVLVALTSKRSVPSIRHYESDIVLVALTSKRSVPSIRHYESDNILVDLQADDTIERHSVGGPYAWRPRPGRTRCPRRSLSLPADTQPAVFHSSPHLCGQYRRAGHGRAGSSCSLLGCARLCSGRPLLRGASRHYDQGGARNVEALRRQGH